MMKIRPIKTEADYKEALSEINQLWGAEVDTPRGDKLDVLLTLVEAYEDKHHAINPPDPVEAIKFRMEQLSLSRKDLESSIGSRGRVSEILNRKRDLSLKMIRQLHHNYNIPLESLIGDPHANS
ncbi:DNA-binding protein [Marinicella pacifica]|uniref:DNA-binding protein n=1 Tax=Marinicella pacifica TaxID=1171543 RepID=A0A917FHY2_9GAMM|nr:DNA-binding protein [Marinicella pacifica]